MPDFVQSNYPVDTGTAYPLNIDQGIAALAQRPMFNRITNGDFLIDQANEGGLYTVPTVAQWFTVDGWSGQGVTSAGQFNVRRLADPDFPSQKCMEITCLTADASIAAGDLYFVYTSIEGVDVADLKSGTASAGKITIAFNMKFSVAGVYGISIANAALNRCYIGTVTQLVANTREAKIVTLTLDLTGTWLFTTGIGLQVRFCLAAGSTFQGTAGAWGAGNLYTTSSQVNFMSSTSNIGYISGMRLVSGVWPASAWANYAESYSEALYRCQRYYEKSFSQGQAAVNNASTTGAQTQTLAIGGAVTSWFSSTRFQRTKRTPPTVLFFNNSANNAFVRNIATGTDGTPSYDASDSNLSISVLGVAGWAAGNSLAVQWAAHSRLGFS